jgi:hypothetical protein
LLPACFFTKPTPRSAPCSWSQSFFADGLTAAFYGFFPLYLPELFPTAVRATEPDGAAAEPARSPAMEASTDDARRQIEKLTD